MSACNASNVSSESKCISGKSTHSTSTCALPSAGMPLDICQLSGNAEYASIPAFFCSRAAAWEISPAVLCLSELLSMGVVVAESDVSVADISCASAGWVQIKPPASAHVAAASMARPLTRTG